jgi:NAD(P)-dependent dehydrogenase (short-subunit alcohol dehydrogenase family)
MMDISGKTAIVTGAASGIGLGIATALAEAGANVVMADIQKAAVEQAAHGLSGTNKQVMPVQIDVTREQSVVDALAEAEQNFGKLHIACNNAGVPMDGTRLIDVPPGDWEFVMGVNIWGIIHGIRHLVPAILKHGEEGHVVNTASVAGFQNRRGTNQGPYSMSKYAALSLSEALEHELARLARQAVAAPTGLPGRDLVGSPVLPARAPRAAARQAPAPGNAIPRAPEARPPPATRRPGHRRGRSGDRTGARGPSARVRPGRSCQGASSQAADRP